jgi:signal transduction histidine kinase
MLAGLGSRDDIVEAYIFVPDHRVFAAYRSAKAKGVPMGREADWLKGFVNESTTFWDFDLDLEGVSRVMSDGQQIGTVVIRSTITPIFSSMKWFVGVLFILMPLAFLALWLVATRFHRLITAPVEQLAVTIRDVSLHEDYRVRARPGGEDEFGQLIAGFNKMLEQIQLRDEQLARYHEELEQQVLERTHELNEANRELEESAERLEDINQELEMEVEQRQQSQQEVESLNEDLVRQKSALEAANQELEAFSFSVSHDLRAPLRHIAGYVDILLEDCAERLQHDDRELLLNIRKGTTRMGELINDLLGLSRVIRHEIVYSTVDVSRQAGEILADLSRAAPERAVDVIVTDGITVSGDEHLVRIVMENLLGNAWKYTAKNDKARIEVGSTVGSDTMVIFVRDNGVGFDMAYADKLFAPFQRLHSMSEFEGTGIGLATVKGVGRGSFPPLSCQLAVT